MPTSVAAMTFEVSIGVVLALRGRYTWRGKFLVREVIRNCGNRCPRDRPLYRI